MKIKKPSVFEYEDYRAYLRDLYEYYKASTTYFSYRYFSQKAGFRSPNFLKLVIDAQRNLTEKSIPQVTTAFRMSRQEADYFSSLVFFCQAAKQKDRSHFAKALARSRTSHKTISITQAQLKYYSQWYYIPLRELVGTAHFVEDELWIQEQFLGELSLKQIRETLDDLLTLGLIARDKNGKLQLSHKDIASPNEIGNSLIINYLEEMIDKGRESIADFGPAEREVSGTCIPCSAKTVVQLKKMIQNFRKDVVAVVGRVEDADRVYQLNFQLFPMTGVKKRGNC